MAVSSKPKSKGQAAVPGASAAPKKKKIKSKTVVSTRFRVCAFTSTEFAAKHTEGCHGQYKSLNESIKRISVDASTLLAQARANALARGDDEDEESSIVWSSCLVVCKHGTDACTR